MSNKKQYKVDIMKKVSDITFNSRNFDKDSLRPEQKHGAKIVERYSWEDISLYPERKHIAEIEKLIPDSAYAPAPSVTDREFWEKIAKLKSSRIIIENAVKCSNEPVVLMTNDIYLDFSRTGSRERGYKVYKRRKRNLRNLVLAECLENKGRFIKPIEAYIESYLVMKTWSNPAHDLTLRIYHGEITGVDLLAVDVAIQLSATYSLLKAKLNDALEKRMKTEVNRRIIEPYLKACRAGITEDDLRWLRLTSNWNAVCNCGLVYSAIIMSESPRNRAEVVACALGNIKLFLQGYSDDGYCSEGIGYWNYGFGNYLLLGEVLEQYTDNRINIFESEKVRKMAGFCREFELVDGIFPIYSDNEMSASAKIYPRLALARNFNIPLTTAKPDKLHGEIEQILINNTSSKKVIAGCRISDLRSWFNFNNVFIFRSELMTNSLYASIKAGHNAEFHNHNDVGSYVVLLDGFMPVCDPGCEVYTKRTFSPCRYESSLLNSWGHSVPIVGGKLQSTGFEFEGKLLKHSFFDAVDSVLIDLKPVYELSFLTKHERGFVFDRRVNTVTVSDTVVFSKPEIFGTAIVTYGSFKVVSTQEIYIYNHKNCVKVSIKASGGEIKITPEQINENSSNVKKPYRIGIDFTVPVTKASIEVKYQKAVTYKEMITK